jgi:6-phosphogluconolactonase (cycloisomerase 2 family)
MSSSKEEGSMKFLAVLTVAIAACVAAAASTGSARADVRSSAGVVFVQTNQTEQNRILVFARSATGLLTPAGSYATGGAGGVAAPGTESDHLASQGSLVYDTGHGLLLAVNAGSNTVSVFRVAATQLSLIQVLSSGGHFPASIAVHDDLVYVLNAGESGLVTGFRIAGSGLQPIPGSTRSLGLANAATPHFLTSPGQVGFTPDGQHLVVTTKAGGNSIDVFAIGADGRPSAIPVVNAPATPVPFAFTFAPTTGRLVSGEAAASTLSTYLVAANSTLYSPHSAPDGQTALCWVSRVGAYYYVSNTGSNTISAYTLGAEGQPVLIGGNGVVATTEAGPIDSASAGSFLYVETGLGGTVDEFRVQPNGALERIGTMSGLPQGIEGIAAS